LRQELTQKNQEISTKTQEVAMLQEKLKIKETSMVELAENNKVHMA